MHGTNMTIRYSFSRRFLENSYSSRHYRFGISMFQNVSSDGLRCNKMNCFNVNQIRLIQDGEEPWNR